jgi:hypothetical protein
MGTSRQKKMEAGVEVEEEGREEGRERSSSSSNSEKGIRRRGTRTVK